MITLVVEPGTLRPGAEITLPPGETRHLKVRRGRDGETVRLVDGQGTVADAGLLDADRAMVRAVRQVARPEPLMLAVGAGDKERWGWLAEKAAELGVTDLIPLETERTAGVANRLRIEHLDRLRRKATESIKQSGAAWAPAVHDHVSVAELCARPFDGQRWLADQAGGPPGVVPSGSAVLVAVGPEGGFTEEERRRMLGAGWVPVRLGPHILRFETAALAAACTAGSLRLGGDD